MNKSYMMIMFGLIMMITLSALVYFEMRSPVIYILLLIGFFMIGIGILMGFAKMISEGK